MDELRREAAREKSVDSGRHAPRCSWRRMPSMVLTFVLMAVTWVVLSGQFDAFHLTLGVISCGLVSYFSHDLLFPCADTARITGVWLRFLVYIPWLIVQIFKANFWVMYLTFHPDMRKKIDPQIIRFKSKLKDELAIVTFANSITLTPGTITISVDAQRFFTVHALDAKSAAGLPGDMENKIAWVFGEDI